MKPLEILVTNDDGWMSPLLPVLIRKLGQYGNVTVVCPLEEQSWRGKAITRYDKVRVHEVSADGLPVFAVSGTPADCANIGIYQICRTRPNIVVSGINTGLNAGLGFCLSSGTVGACFEANIAGLPAIAFSQAFEADTMKYFQREGRLPAGALERFTDQGGQMVDRMFEAIHRGLGVLSREITWSINCPPVIPSPARVKLCSLGHSFYGSVFSKTNGHYEHDLRDVKCDENPDCDSVLLSRGFVTVTPIDLRSLGKLSQDQVDILQDFFNPGAGSK